MTRTENDRQEWLGTMRTAAILGINPATVPTVARAAGVRIRVIPGVPTKYLKSDIEAICAGAIRVAGADPAPTTAA